MAIIKIQHARTLGYCLKGVKKVIEKHNLDWKMFVKEGLPEEQLKDIDDAMIKKAIELAKKDK